MFGTVRTVWGDPEADLRFNHDGDVLADVLQLPLVIESRQGCRVPLCSQDAIHYHRACPICRIVDTYDTRCPWCRSHVPPVPGVARMRALDRTDRPIDLLDPEQWP